MRLGQCLVAPLTLRYPSASHQRTSSTRDSFTTASSTVCTSLLELVLLLACSWLPAQVNTSSCSFVTDSLPPSLEQFWSGKYLLSKIAWRLIVLILLLLGKHTNVLGIALWIYLPPSVST